MNPTTIARTTTHPKHAARPTDYDRVRESQAHNAASQGVHVPLLEGEGDHAFLKGRHHYPEAAAQIDQAVGAFFTGRVA